MRRSATAALLLLAASGCHRASPKVAEERPDWSRFTIDGIAPLMSPAQVGRALTAHGYRSSDCGVHDEPIDPNALEQSTQSFCYDDPGRGWRASLYFLDIVEGRRLAVIGFRDLTFHRDERVADARDAAFRRKLFARFGKPYLTQTSFGITSRVWTVPGGSASLPDNIKTSDDRYSGRNVELTSFWAYGHQRPMPAASSTP